MYNTRIRALTLSIHFQTDESAARLFLLFSFSVQQTTSGIGHRVKLFFRVGNQYAECEKINNNNNKTKYCKARTNLIVGTSSLKQPIMPIEDRLFIEDE